MPDVRTIRRQVAARYQAAGIPRLYTRLKLWILPVECAAHLPQRGTILDVGCGYGYLANYLSLDGSERRILGCDVASDRIEVARRTIGARDHIEFQVARLQDLTDGAFDGAVIADVLHHLPYGEQPVLLGALHGKLKPGGVLVMRETDIKFDLRYALFNYVLEWLLYRRAEKLKFRKTADWRRLLESVGFTVQRVLPNRPWFPYITSTFVCLRP